MSDGGDSAIQEGSTAHNGKFFVVGIGASAGGIAPILKFFSEVPADSGMVYVVILHLAANYDSNLPELIQGRTPIPVSQVNATMQLERNHIYVIPPSKYLTLMDGTIRLTEPERSRGAHTSIDLFLRTLASAYGKESIAILLSGSGNDGVLGLGRIKEAGGFVIVQEPNEAEYPDMPRNAIASGRVDLVMPVEEMPAKLLSLRDGARRLQLPIEEEEPPPEDFDESSFRDILTMLRVRTGNDFSQYKRPTLLRRIARRMQVQGMTEMRAYLNLIRENPDEIAALLQDLLITVTNFFRDRDAFERLESDVIPRLFTDKENKGQVRVWSAGCATGEEAYSLAILLAECAQHSEATQSIQIFATDIDDRAIVEARECRYPASIELDVSPERLQRFFIKDGDHYMVKKDLREMVLFAPHNIVRDPPFSRLDLISCRNLLIYLNRSMQERILEIFHFALRPGGYLFLGASESAEALPGLFEPVDKKRRIYQRRVAVNTYVPAVNLMSGNWQVKIPELPSASGAGAISPTQLHQEVLEQLSPPSILINEEYDILHLSPNAGQFLRIPAGEPSRNLLKLVSPDLRLELRAALLEARSPAGENNPEPRLVKVTVDGKTRTLSLTVHPVRDTPAAARGCLLVTFAEERESQSFEGHLKIDADNLAIVRELEHELQRTKDQLRITIEQYETSTEELRASNEGLQAINEELRSASEELETSKEELQSVNEELITVNQEYREKIDEIGRTNSDLQNLMASTEIGTIFLDRHLKIKRYTPRAQQLFNITPSDIGRPLEHFTHKLDYNSFTKDATEVLRTLQQVEREVRSSEGHYYLLRLVPYRTLDDKIDGVVLTFVDITVRKAAEEALSRQAEILREQAAVLNLATVMVLDEDWRISAWSTGCERLYGFSNDEALGQLSYELLKTEAAQPRATIIEQLRRTGEWQGEFVNTTRSGDVLIVAGHLILHHREQNQPPVMLMVNNDVTASRLAEEALREADRNKDRFLATLAHELRNPLAAMRSCTMILQERGAEPQAHELARSVLQRQLNYLMRLVDDLLDVERLIHGKINLEKRPVVLGEMIEGAIETCRQPLGEKKHNLTVSLPPEPLTINGDLTRLAQIVANLLHNAIKYTEPGGEISITAERAGPEVLIRVRDNGMGIEPEMLSSIFELYSQRNVSGQDGQQGLGIGLSLVRELAQLHGGSVAASSEGLGHGSEFVVRLPLSTNAESADSSAGPVERAVTSSGSGKRVLLVEDNRDVADATAQVLRHAGHELAVAHNARRALELIEEFRPQVAVLDIGLPGMDGYALARQIREQRPGVILLALSGWSKTDNNPGAAEEAGFARYFTKPIDPIQLGNFIREL
jgi:two-component system CheB/CheR fusion protein